MSIDIDALNPFTPDDGQEPDIFPGREKEQAILLEQITRLKHGAKIGSNIIISAPRGNGKLVAGNPDIGEIHKRKIQGRTEPA